MILCVFMWFSVIMGAIWDPFWLPWAPWIKRISDLGADWVPKSLQDPKNVTLGVLFGGFGEDLGRFWIDFGGSRDGF